MCLFALVEGVSIKSLGLSIHITICKVKKVRIDAQSSSNAIIRRLTATSALDGVKALTVTQE